MSDTPATVSNWPQCEETTGMVIECAVDQGCSGSATHCQPVQLSRKFLLKPTAYRIWAAGLWRSGEKAIMKLWKPAYIILHTSFSHDRDYKQNFISNA